MYVRNKCAHKHPFANMHLQAQIRICEIVQLVTHLGITSYSQSFQSTKYWNVYIQSEYVHTYI